jgi:hypothetical protein
MKDINQVPHKQMPDTNCDRFSLSAYTKKGELKEKEKRVWKHREGIQIRFGGVLLNRGIMEWGVVMW